MEEEVKKDITPRLIKDLGMRYPMEKSNYKVRYGLFECQYCGKEFECRISSVNNGDIKSCGCQKYIRSHGLTHNKWYSVWGGIIGRCYKPQNKSYKNYGARGITVCEEWLDITTFIAWAEATHPNIEGVSLDRIDNDKGYSPENCRWADKVTQNTNQRKSSANTSGFVGVYWDISKNKWTAKVGSNNKLIHLGYFNSVQEAVQARDNYIIENKLPHKLSTDYKKEN